jgi:uncharacterized membrane protein YccC
MMNITQALSVQGVRRKTVDLARQMDWFRGLRAAVALCGPIVIGELAHLPNFGWAALGGIEAIIADTGGPYRSRLSSLATLSFGGAIGLFLGCMAGRSLFWALPVTVAFCFLWSYLAVLGQPFSSAGLLVQVIYICGVGAPAPSFPVALEWSLALLAGGAWSAALSLFLWPLDAYRPARAAVADCYEELASFLGSVADLAGRDKSQRRGPTAALWHRLAKHHQYRIRRAVERGWQTVANVRAERTADSARGRQLVVLLEHADLLIARTVALAENLEVQSAADSSPCFDRGLYGLDELRSAERLIASLLTRRGQTLADVHAKIAEMQELPRKLEGCLNASDANNRFMMTQVTEAALLLETALESASLLRTGKSPEISARTTHASSGHSGYVHERIGKLRQGPDLELLVANFTRKSLSLRHAARVAIVCGINVALILLLHIDHGYWLLLTSLIVLQPHVSGTLRRGLERIAGTIGGGILAAVLAVALHSNMMTAAVLFPLALLSLAVLPISYAGFVFFLTPTFVLAWLPYSGDWQLAFVRTMDTLAGATIAVLAMLFFFPVYERDRAHEFLRVSLAADRLYLTQLAAAWRNRSRSSRPLANARRATGLAHNDSEESLERLLAESWPRRLPFAQFATAFVTYLRRFAQSVTTLTTLDGEWEWKQSLAIQSRLELLERRLVWLEHQIAQAPTSGSIQTHWPEPSVWAMNAPAHAQEHPGERQLARLERQTEILRRQLQSLREHGGLPEAAKSSSTRFRRTIAS